MAIEARIPLKRKPLWQLSQLVVTADGVTVELRGWGRFFKRPWFIPRSQVGVVDPARKGFDLEAAGVWNPRLIVPKFVMGGGEPNLRLLFKAPQRLPVLNGGMGKRAAAQSRSAAGLRLDGIELDAA